MRPRVANLCISYCKAFAFCVFNEFVVVAILAFNSAIAYDGVIARWTVVFEAKITAYEGLSFTSKATPDCISIAINEAILTSKKEIDNSKTNYT